MAKMPACKYLKYRVFYATVGFDTAAAANPCCVVSSHLACLKLRGGFRRGLLDRLVGVIQSHYGISVLGES